jgi:molybdopterin biosynthesis enzyme
MPPSVNAYLDKEIENGPQFRFLFVNVRHVDEKLVANPVEGGSSALTTIVKSNGYTIISPHTSLKKGTKVRVTLFGRLELTQLSATRSVLEDSTRGTT